MFFGGRVQQLSARAPQATPVFVRFFLITLLICYAYVILWSSPLKEDRPRRVYPPARVVVVSKPCEHCRDRASVQELRNRLSGVLHQVEDIVDRLDQLDNIVVKRAAPSS